jgi:transposase
MQQAGVGALGMKIVGHYRNAVDHLLPQAEIAREKFYLCAYFNKSVETVRKRLAYCLLAPWRRQTLERSKYFWLRNFPDLRAQPAFQQLYRLSLCTNRAWRLKDTIRGFWQYRYNGAARRFFRDWLAHVTQSRLTPRREVT